MSVLRLDYHMHPNFGHSRTLARRRARAWWDAFTQHALDAVVVTEHAYARPQLSFELLREARPRNARTEIFPGVEILTEQGIDLIVFAESPDLIYTASRLLEPFGLQYRAAVDEIQGRGLSAYVTHPSHMSNTSVLHHKGRDFTREMIELLGAFERHNASLIDIHALCQVFPGRLFDHMIEKFEHHATIPSVLYKDIAYKFWTGGSDAHHPFEVGSAVVLSHHGAVTRQVLWERMHTKHDGEFVFRDTGAMLRALVRQSMSTFSEYVYKKWYKTTRRV